LHPYYSESCAANMVVAYSSGSRKHIVCPLFSIFPFADRNFRSQPTRVKMNVPPTMEEHQPLRRMLWAYLPSP
jgi:hypothetical protein